MKKFLRNGRSEAGFTLIELLVVIAIIGILASVILASLNSARAKGDDAAAKEDLDNSRAQAQLYYDSNNNNYAGACAALSSVNPGGIKDLIADASSKEGLAAAVGGTGTPASQTQAVCHDSTTAWVAEVPLKSLANPGYWCVDSNGASEQEPTATANPSTGIVAATITQCP